MKEPGNSLFKQNSFNKPIIDWQQAGLQPIKVPKGHLLQMPGSIATKGYYVISGLLRSYAVDDNGKIHIFMFAPEDWVISDAESQAMSTPSDLFIDALEDSVVVELSNDIFEKRMKKEDSSDAVFKLFKRVGVLQKRVIMLMSATARQRYEHFLETYPQLVNRIPLKLIASYLGITPEALSNIRSKMRNQNR